MEVTCVGQEEFTIQIGCKTRTDFGEDFAHNYVTEKRFGQITPDWT